MKANDEDYTVVRHGALGVLLKDRDQPLAEGERGHWSPQHVQAAYCVIVAGDGDECVLDDGFTYKYNPAYAPGDDEGLARDILECVALDLSYDNDYWPKGDAEDLAVCVLRYVRDTGMELPEDDEKVADFVEGFRKVATLYDRLVDIGGSEGVNDAINELRARADA